MTDRLVGPSAPNINGDIFRQVFTERLGDSFDRAQGIFDALSAHHLRSFAILVHHSAARGEEQLDTTLGAMEKLLADDSFLHAVEDPIVREVEIKKFVDVIYAQMLGVGPEGHLDPAELEVIGDNPWSPLIEMIDTTRGRPFTELATAS